MMEYLGSLLILVILALLVEAVWEGIKKAFPPGLKAVEKKGIPVDAIGALVLGLVVCISTGTDLFALIGIKILTPLGAILTGIIVSRGSNAVHELIGALKTARVVEYVELEEIKTHIGEVVKDE